MLIYIYDIFHVIQSLFVLNKYIISKTYCYIMSIDIKHFKITFKSRKGLVMNL